MDRELLLLISDVLLYQPEVLLIGGIIWEASSVAGQELFFAALRHCFDMILIIVIEHVCLLVLWEGVYNAGFDYRTLGDEFGW